jgi:hypothetical protein
MPDTIQIDREQTAEVFAQWWADFEAHPENFVPGPDLPGKDSADLFLEYAIAKGAKQL